jgi:hypothetical protein
MQVKLINFKIKIKTIWDIFISETNKTGNSEKITTLNIEGTLVSNHQEIADEFNKYFFIYSQKY